MFDKLKKKIRVCFYWSRHYQIRHLHGILLSDAQWLVNDPTAKALTERYLELVKDCWYDYQFEPIDKHRDRLWLNPWKEDKNENFRCGTFKRTHRLLPR